MTMRKYEFLNDFTPIGKLVIVIAGVVLLSIVIMIAIFAISL